MNSSDYTNTDSPAQEPSPDDLPAVTAYVDGACQPNPGNGGIGIVLLKGDARKEISRSIGKTTNNGAEITAAIEALNSLKVPCRVNLYSNSRYLVSTMNGDYRRGSNMELWEQLDAAAERHECHWHWLRGHAGNPNNERANTLAENAALQRNGGQPS